MRLYFGGSEVKVYREMLAEMGAENVALSFISLSKRNSGGWSISENYPEFQNIFLDSGAYSLNKFPETFTEGKRKLAEAQADAYMTLVLSSIGRVSLVSEFDAQILGQERIEEFRKSFYNDLPPEKFMPIWHAETGVDELERLCGRYQIVGILSKDLDLPVISRLNSYSSRFGTRFHGAAVTSLSMISKVNWDSVSSTSWLSPSHFGDTIIWTGNRLKRYPKAYKEKGRNENSGYLQENGFDAQKILDDDPHEVLRLSIWSWNKFMENFGKRGVTASARNEIDDFVENGITAVDQGLPDIRNENLPAVPQTSLFEAVLSNEPVQIRTTEQRKNLHSALVELQAQRVLSLKKQEDAAGGYTDINLSAEIDRLHRLLRDFATLERSQFSVKFEASASAPEAGYFSSIFGKEAGKKLNAIEDNVVDAEVIDEE